MIDLLICRFLSHIEINGPKDCWVWISGKDESGYGIFGETSKKKHKAHRFSWSVFVGEIPAGMLVLHKCDRPECCNPSHLFIGDQKANMADMVAKGRSYHPVGELNPKSKLSKNDVVAMRSKGKFRGYIKSLAAEFRVSTATVKRIMKFDSWR